MVQDRLTNAVLRRLKELGLPPSLINLGQFRDNFFLRGWVMFVRDGDEVANVHLVEPPQDTKPLSRECADARQARRDR
jgi:hypothetical protein